MIRHHFTIDVEEYFHPTALMGHYAFEDWDQLPRRAATVVPRVLDLLDQHGDRGTFFVVGWLAEREPAMIHEIVSRGHEIASHGYEHRMVGELGPRGMRESVHRSKAVLEDLTGYVVKGYRAPSFSIVPGLEWAFDILIEEGYAYDASLFPISQHPTYGYPSADPDPHWIERPSGVLAEFPATTCTVLSQRLPASGGAYLRLLPLALTRAGFRQTVARDAPAMLYVHPWELDEWAPDVKAPLIQRVRTFAGRRRMWAKLSQLLRSFRFGRVDETLREMAASRAQGAP